MLKVNTKCFTMLQRRDIFQFGSTVSQLALLEVRSKYWSLLEKLILEHPRSALVPQARRELERLSGRVPGAGV